MNLLLALRFRSVRAAGNFKRSLGFSAGNFTSVCSNVIPEAQVGREDFVFDETTK